MTKEQVAELNKPLLSSYVKQRETSGIKLSYLEAWHVIAEANRIFGFDGWDRTTQDLQMIQCEQKGEKQLWYVGYTAKSIIRVGSIKREGMGFGQGIDRDLGKAHESAIKEAESDAMKRAFMTFGNPFGLALYDKQQANVVKEMTPEEADKIFKKATAIKWKGMGGTVEQFKELDQSLKESKASVDVYQFITSAIEEGCESIHQVHQYALSVKPKMNVPFTLEV